MSIVMDFTTPAMARPDILDKTYSSFSKNLKGIDLKECRLFINIDPLPSDVNRTKVIEVAKKYFGEVHPNCPDKANFTTACNWLWSNAETEYIFHIEDDWQLIKEVPVKRMLKYFKKHSELMEVCLRAYRYKYTICPLSPNIMHKRYYKAVAGKLNEKVNPEIQLRGKNFGIEMPAPSLGVKWQGKIIAYPENQVDVVIKDIGREWLKKSKFKKPRRKGKFTSWETKK